MAFIRRFDYPKVEAMKKTKLWRDCLYPDIMKGIVFPAIRDNEMYFYFSGGCMIRYTDNSFKFNPGYFKLEYRSEEVKKAWQKFVFPDNLLINKILSIESICKEIEGFDFCEQYKNIKDLMKQKFQDTKNDETLEKERKYLEKLYPYTYGEENSDVIVIDIEIRGNFETKVEKAKSAKCDLMLYNTKTRILQLAEAKLCRNPEVRSKSNSPKVIGQMNKYNSWIETAQDRENFVKNYRQYISIMNELFGKNYESPMSINESTKLVLFEGKEDFKSTHLPKLINSNIGKKNIAYFTLGDEISIVRLLG